MTKEINYYLAIYESYTDYPTQIWVDDGDSENDELIIRASKDIKKLEETIYHYNKEPHKFLDIIIRLTKIQTTDLLLGNYTYDDLSEILSKKKYPWDSFIVAIKPIVEPKKIKILSKDYEE